MDKSEQQYTSTEYKLLRHGYRLDEVRRHTIRPIHVEMAPEERCNLNCSFCSVKNRDKTKSMSLADVKWTILEFMKLGVRAISWTGGGEISLWPHINEAMEFVDEDKGGIKIKQGMISNGVSLCKNVKYTNLKKLTWLRISLNCLESHKDIKLKIPPNVDLGFSYVITKNNFNTKVLDKLEHYVKKYKAKYLRLVPNCLDTVLIDSLPQIISKMLKGRDNRIFCQSKSYDKPKQCLWGYIKPFVNQGKVYWCSANPLIERKFNENHVMGTIHEIPKIWDDPKPRTTENCGLCFFSKQNDLLMSFWNPMEHREFV